MPISKLPALFEVISIILFIGSSALLFRSRYEKNETLVAIAGLVALLAFGYFVADLFGGGGKSPLVPESSSSVPSDHWPWKNLTPAEIERLGKSWGVPGPAKRLEDL